MGRMLELVPNDANFDFIGKWKICSVLSLLLVTFSIFIFFNLGEEKYGTDFKGGHDILVKVAPTVHSDALRAAVRAAGLEGEVQSFQTLDQSSNQFSVRIGGTGSDAETKSIQQKLTGVLKTVSPDMAEILQTEFVGPTIGKELRQKALVATLLGVVGLLIYISIRFEFAFGLGAVVAVFHDVLIATGIYLFLGHQINMGYIAAALTILGYSVNDTIVIFDRVREELPNPKYKDLTLPALINHCLNETLSRTIITVFLTLFSVLALLLFGGGSIRDLSIFLLIGMILGTYSTIYIASPVVLGWEWWRRRREGRQAATA